MATLTIEAPQSLAEALEPLDKPLAIEEYALKLVISWNLHQAHNQLWKLADAPLEDDDLADAAQQLRCVAKSLEALAAAVEAVA